VLEILDNRRRGSSNKEIYCRKSVTEPEWKHLSSYCTVFWTTWFLKFETNEGGKHHRSIISMKTINTKVTLRESLYERVF